MIRWNEAGQGGEADLAPATFAALSADSSVLRYDAKGYLIRPAAAKADQRDEKPTSRAPVMSTKALRRRRQVLPQFGWWRRAIKIIRRFGVFSLLPGSGWPSFRP
ncbi:hypothetical protein ACTTAI_00505 (plasmid) [Rhodobacter capsulatus]|uniref:hypothetical protein n=1 Tax=Rhodobacter capsulatus TaxID=1061 RepID=UPI0040291FBF